MRHKTLNIMEADTGLLSRSMGLRSYNAGTFTSNSARHDAAVGMPAYCHGLHKIALGIPNYAAKVFGARARQRSSGAHMSRIRRIQTPIRKWFDNNSDDTGLFIDQVCNPKNRQALLSLEGMMMNFPEEVPSDSRYAAYREFTVIHGEPHRWAQNIKMLFRLSMS
jgi:hypothetical protein